LKDLDPPAEPFEDLSAYRGRWVARVGGHLVAQGGTPQQALRAALAIRYKERPSITYVDTVHPLIFPNLLKTLLTAIPGGQPVYLVGGAVRDAILHKEAHDLDFCMAGDPKPIARQVANTLGGAFYMLDDERHTARVIYTSPEGVRYSIDFAAFRGSDLEADLRGRDFTLNAIAVDLNASQQLLDPLGGTADLRNGLLRACSSTSFQEDPLRIMRGIRLAAAYSFHVVEETRQAMKDASALLSRVSAERKRDELFRILDGQQPATALRGLDWLGALQFLLPELANLKGVTQSPPHTLDVWEHTLTVLQELRLLIDVLTQDHVPQSGLDSPLYQAATRFSRFRERFQIHFSTQLNPNRSLRALLSLAALYHDIAKPATREVDPDGRIQNLGHEKLGAEAAVQRAQALQLSNLECERLRTLIRHHMRIHSLVLTGAPATPRAIYRFFRDTGEAGVDITIHTLADTLATYGPTLPKETWATYLDICEVLLETYWERHQQAILPPALLNGHDLLEAGMAPGPRMGLLLEAVREAQATGLIQTRDEAFQFVKDWLKKK